jgi:hypothetical protein
MKKLLGVDIAGSYSFDKVAKTITFSNLATSITLDNILLINDATANTLLYNFCDPLLGAASLVNNVLTLDLNTNSATFANTDLLQIWLDVADDGMPSVVLDQSQPVMVGGVSPSGANLRTRVGADGGFQLTDAPQPIVGISQAALTTPTGWINTTGYQSIVVTFSTSALCTVVFQTTNDIQYPVAGGNAGGWPVTGANAPAVTLANPTSGAVWVFPVTGKYFRIYVTALTAGQILTTQVQLRAAPANFIPSTQSVNVSQIGGTAVVTGGLTGVQAVAGNVAVGVAPTTNPLPTGGADYAGLTRRFTADGQGNQQIVGPLPVGYQYGTFNATYGRATQTLASQTAAQSTFPPVTVGGLDATSASRPMLTTMLGSPVVTQSPSTISDQSIPELLYQILATLRVIATYEYQINQGVNPVTATDEPDVLLADYMSQSSSFTNMAN